MEASKATPAKKKGDKVSKADVAISKIRRLYAIEDRLKDLEPEQKTLQRQKLSRPILDDLNERLEKNIRRAPKDSLTWIAIRYTLNQWDLLTGYREDGLLNISNALAENAIRPFAVGVTGCLVIPREGLGLGLGLGLVRPAIARSKPPRPMDWSPTIICIVC